jgi:hypothetical protein
MVRRLTEYELLAVGIVPDVEPVANRARTGPGTPRIDATDYGIHARRRRAGGSGGKRGTGQPLSFAVVQKLGLISDVVENRSARIEQNALCAEDRAGFAFRLA